MYTCRYISYLCLSDKCHDTTSPWYTQWAKKMFFGRQIFHKLLAGAMSVMTMQGEYKELTIEKQRLPVRQLRRQGNRK